MGLLRNIEHGIESVVEGVFGKVFRSHVQPVELAKKLAKEMDDAKTVSVSRVYVPNEYHLYLSPRDRDQFEQYETDLLNELTEYLTEHARKEGYALLSRPRVLLRQDPDLAVGEFGIATRMVQPHRQTPKPSKPSSQTAKQSRPAPPPPPPPPPPTESAQPPASTPERTHGDGAQAQAEAMAAGTMTGGTAAAASSKRTRPILMVGNQPYELQKPIIVIGRSRECDIRLDDSSASRKHAEIRRENGRYFLVDLGSTNGVTLNGQRVTRAQLSLNDQIVIGETPVTFGKAS